MNMPPNIHLTITPIHERVVDEMLKDLKESTSTLLNLPPTDVESIIESLGLIMSLITPKEIDIPSLGKILREIERYVSIYGSKLLETLQLDKGLPKEMALINQLLKTLSHLKSRSC